MCIVETNPSPVECGDCIGSTTTLPKKLRSKSIAVLESTGKTVISTTKVSTNMLVKNTTSKPSSTAKPKKVSKTIAKAG